MVARGRTAWPIGYPVVTPMLLVLLDLAADIPGLFTVA